MHLFREDHGINFLNLSQKVFHHFFGGQPTHSVFGQNIGDFIDGETNLSGHVNENDFPHRIGGVSAIPIGLSMAFDQTY
jgi:hypothetical protein